MFVVVVAGSIGVRELTHLPASGMSRQSADLVSLTISVSLILYMFTGVPDALAATLSERRTRNQPITVRGLLREGVPRMIGSGSGSVPPVVLACVPPLAVLLWVLFVFVPAVKTYEGLGAVRAMGRSATLVKGAWGHVFRTRVLAVVVTYGVWMAAMSVLTLSGALLGLDVSGDVGELSPLGIGFVVVVMLVGFVTLMFQSAYAELVIVEMYKALRSRHPPVA
ncbi:hypothetical protein ACIBEA_02980 [Streptomyces sp. NPDC051555]|uniref:hypothetical protein n=1 Tax=Streptomyces sp. NPDC051555 TaxID=3365657 RepID=UPI0037A561D2